MATLISGRSMQMLWVCLGMRALDEKIIDFLWQKEVRAFLLHRSYPLGGSC